MRIALIGLLAAIMLAGTAACFWADDAIPPDSASTPDINATISAAVEKAVAEEIGRTEAAAPAHVTVTPVSATGQTNWLDGLSQFHRVKVARDEVQCVGYDGGRYVSSSRAIIKVDDGFYALGNPGQAVAFWDENSGCRIGVITDESLE